MYRKAAKKTSSSYKKIKYADGGDKYPLNMETTAQISTEDHG